MPKKKKVVKPITRLVRLVNNELTEFKIEYGNNWDSESVLCNTIEQAWNYAKFDSPIKKQAPADSAFISKIEDMGSCNVILETAKAE